MGRGLAGVILAAAISACSPSINYSDLHIVPQGQAPSGVAKASSRGGQPAFYIPTDSSVSPYCLRAPASDFNWYLTDVTACGIQWEEYKAKHGYYPQIRDSARPLPKPLVT